MISFLNVTYPKINLFQKFKSRKLLTSIEHIPLDSIGVKYYSSWRKPIVFPLVKIAG